MDVADELEIVLLAQTFLLALDPAVHKLDNPAAFQADEVVVVGLAQLVLVPEPAVADVQLADKANLLQYVQRPVDGGPGDGDSLIPQGEKDVVALPVFLAGQDVFQDGQALGCKAQGARAKGLFEALDVFRGNFHN